MRQGHSVGVVDENGCTPKLGLDGEGKESRLLKRLDKVELRNLQAIVEANVWREGFKRLVGYLAVSWVVFEVLQKLGRSEIMEASFGAVCTAWTYAL
jgi:hypothetical protein